MSENSSEGEISITQAPTTFNEMSNLMKNEIKVNV